MCPHTHTTVPLIMSIRIFSRFLSSLKFWLMIAFPNVYTVVNLCFSWIWGYYGRVNCLCIVYWSLCKLLISCDSFIASFVPRLSFLTDTDNWPCMMYSRSRRVHNQGPMISSWRDPGQGEKRKKYTISINILIVLSDTGTRFSGTLWTRGLSVETWSWSVLMERWVKMLIIDHWHL